MTIRPSIRNLTIETNFVFSDDLPNDDLPNQAFTASYPALKSQKLLEYGAV